jgi:hypothetical protein
MQAELGGGTVNDVVDKLDSFQLKNPKKKCMQITEREKKCKGIGKKHTYHSNFL